ncbi:HAD family hydrolase [bacterium]
MAREQLPAVAFFDVDDTILKGPSIIMAAKYMLFEKGQAGAVSPSFLLDGLKALIDVRTGAVDYDTLVEKGLSQFVGHTLAELEEVAQGAFDDYMRKNIYKLAYREIRKHQKAGRKVILLTASLTPIIQPLADFLGADSVIALNPIFENGRMTGRAEKPFCYEKGKLLLAREYCLEHDIDLKDCYFYSDSSSDLPLMEKVGHPRPTCPDPALRRIALLRNWRMHFFHSLLPPDFTPEHWK